MERTHRALRVHSDANADEHPYPLSDPKRHDDVDAKHAGHAKLNGLGLTVALWKRHSIVIGYSEPVTVTVSVAEPDSNEQH